MPHQQSSQLVFVSILNWNDAASTLKCVDAVRQSVVSSDVEINITVLDNGSASADWATLQQGLANAGLTLIRQDSNSGFAAGHNVVIGHAIESRADYIWLLNNDAIVTPDTLAGLLQAITASRDCGVVSPLIYAHHDDSVVDFVGAIHDWQRLDSKRAANVPAAKKMQADHPKEFFVFGTAPLFKTKALVAVGRLEEKMFAYFEDDDLCARLSNAGWSSQMAFTVAIRHFRRTAVSVERPSYFFYLMARNSLLFYLAHTPIGYRRWIRLRLFSRAMIQAANLRAHGQPEKSNACLQGIWDGLLGRGGPPRLSAMPPIWLVWASNAFPYRLQQWLEKT